MTPGWCPIWAVSCRRRAVARWAGADEVAAKLPAHYDTELTRQLAGGVDRSGGEWQKRPLRWVCAASLDGVIPS